MSLDTESKKKLLAILVCIICFLIANMSSIFRMWGFQVDAEDNRRKARIPIESAAREDGRQTYLMNQPDFSISGVDFAVVKTVLEERWDMKLERLNYVTYDEWANEEPYYAAVERSDKLLLAARVSIITDPVSILEICQGVKIKPNQEMSPELQAEFDKVTADFFSDSVSLAYNGNNPELAKSWVADNLASIRLGEKRETVIGQTRYILYFTHPDSDLSYNVDYSYPPKGYQKELRIQKAVSYRKNNLDLSIVNRGDRRAPSAY